MKKKLQEIWDYCAGNQTLSNIASVKKGEAKEKDRPQGECFVCSKFAEEGKIHESPGTAECCKGCDAYEGSE